MSNEALTWAPTIVTARSIDKFVLVVLEAGALGAAPLPSFDEVRRILGCSDRTFRDAMNRLEADGHVRFLSRDPAVIQFGPYELRLDRMPGAKTDDPWQILRAKVFAQKGSQCVYCDRDASHVDHVLPRSRGGADELDNLVPACAACNMAKGSKTPQEWRP